MTDHSIECILRTYSHRVFMPRAGKHTIISIFSERPFLAEWGTLVYSDA
jgi:hypothetical protein